MHQDIRFSPDKYWLEYDGIKISSGKFEISHGKILIIGKHSPDCNGFCIRQKNLDDKL